MPTERLQPTWFTQIHVASSTKDCVFIDIGRRGIHSRVSYIDRQPSYQYLLLDGIIVEVREICQMPVLRYFCGSIVWCPSLRTKSSFFDPILPSSRAKRKQIAAFAISAYQRIVHFSGVLLVTFQIICYALISFPVSLAICSPICYDLSVRYSTIQITSGQWSSMK